MTFANGLLMLAGTACLITGLATSSASSDNPDAYVKPILDRHRSQTLDTFEPERERSSTIPNLTVDDPLTSKELEQGHAVAGVVQIAEAGVQFASASSTPELEIPKLTSPSTVEATDGPSQPNVQILDECILLEVCVDHYLWALYQRTAKLDTSKVHERRKVRIRKKGKTVTVTKRFTRLVPQDFTWKDPAAAEKAGMSLMDYVIGGMEPTFKLKLFQTLRAAEKIGLEPGITSGFRDDYRQSIATGLKAASNRSYHGGSLRGGYGYGIAADIVSTKGATRSERWISTAELWNWIDANEQQYGIGRPYLGRDAPHVGPIDGEEYVARRGANAGVAKSNALQSEPQTMASP
jgi:hypothetical protein